MTNDRIADLEALREDLDQLRLDLDPEKRSFWEVAARIEAIDKTLRLLRLDNTRQA